MYKAIVFNSIQWSKTGDIGDNSQFYQIATITREYLYKGDLLVDVVFNNGLISHGHFKYGIKTL